MKRGREGRGQAPRREQTMWRASLHVPAAARERARCTKAISKETLRKGHHGGLQRRRAARSGRAKEEEKATPLVGWTFLPTSIAQEMERSNDRTSKARAAQHATAFTSGPDTNAVCGRNALRACARGNRPSPLPTSAPRPTSDPDLSNPPPLGPPPRLEPQVSTFVLLSSSNVYSSHVMFKQ